MSIQTIPITPVKADLRSAVRLAVAEVRRFLEMFYPAEVVQQTQAAEAITGQWLSRVKGFHNEDDFWHQTRDFLSYTLSGGARSRVSDQLAYYFSGFMPAYGAACIFLDMVADARPWADVQAFMHTMSYGNARKYVEDFDCASGQQKAQAEFDAWQAILVQEAQLLQKAAYGDDGGEPIILAQAQPQPNGPITDVPANDPHFPKPKPPLRPVPSTPPPELPGSGPSRWFARLPKSPLLLGAVLLIMPRNTFQQNTEDEQLARMRAEYEKQNKLLIVGEQVSITVHADRTNNDCKPQTEENRKNGEVCENAGYTVMETALRYKRLVDPPRGRGLDGLFEKLPPLDASNPMPHTVTQPKPGELVFIPPADRPPQTRYDYVAAKKKQPATSTYPKFVVFEAKHIAKGSEATDTEGIAKEAKRRLGNTCDGTQLGVKWTANRIPKALERQYPGAKNRVLRADKVDEITDARYARWIFVCLPGPMNSNAKLYVLIDVVASGMDLESRPAKARKTAPSQPDTPTY